jgi:SnoaL-like protein
MPAMLEEKDAIREVLAEYCFRLDSGWFEGMAALFAENGTWETAFGKATGREAIAAHAEDIRARRGDDRPRGIHLVANIVITFESDNAADVRSNWTVVQNSPENAGGGPKIGSGGAYHDQMVKLGGRWLFRYRKIDRFIAA